MAEQVKKKAKCDPVNHPVHYEREGAMECIDEMLLIFGKEAVMNFCLCNAWKYRYRASAKNGDEDYFKSDWYLRKYRELKEGVNKSEAPSQEDHCRLNTFYGSCPNNYITESHN